MKEVMNRRTNESRVKIPLGSDGYFQELRGCVTNGKK
jgi:hypothetical protein